jgi:hypothetical protein
MRMVSISFPYTIEGDAHTLDVLATQKRFRSKPLHRVMLSVKPIAECLGLPWSKHRADILQWTCSLSSSPEHRGADVHTIVEWIKTLRDAEQVDVELADYFCEYFEPAVIAALQAEGLAK